MNLEEKLPRERETKTDTERSLIEAAHHEVITEVPPVPRLAYKSWKAIEEAVADYEKATNTHYRVRSSGYVREYNETYSDQLPMGLEFSFKTFRCVNSVYQESRAKGDRSNNTGYTGCKARFTARFVNIASSEEEVPNWRIAIRYAHFYASLKTGNTNVLFDLYTRVGRKFIPQQTKNLLKRIGSNKSSQDRLKMLLDALAQVEGNEVMLMQDQFDVTCGIVIQTSAQKLCFEHWGQTLAMDWTHSTNNLGFHLGNLSTNMFNYMMFYTNANMFFTHKVFVYDKRSHLLPTRIVAFEVLEDDQCFCFIVHSHEVKYWYTATRRPCNHKRI
ncbi:hypothetical protein JG688_00008567 [Phytophthora aleatoria]|uniref:ZSWIM1/3 RNaseH-like domain-containing protein n=1 Tax=Phytophthora aleatoria TaxID=2496075 RepID=A0A8J5IQY1_9STRA|nr:hypothetical protein JG688_00008567 [Phytophthora aleatoria]